MNNREEGATVPEYALIIALLVLALMGAIAAFQNGTEAQFANRKTQGDPGEEFGNLGPSGGTTGGSTDGSDSTPPGGSVSAVLVKTLTAIAPASNNTWSMTVTVQVLGDGDPLDGVVIGAPTWNPVVGAASCTTSGGVCTFSQIGMARTGQSSVEQASFTLGTTTFQNPDGSSPSTSFEGSTTITCTKPGSGSGNGSCS